eukprot:359280-Chlamydomonas_euryale.AAC.2
MSASLYLTVPHSTSPYLTLHHPTSLYHTHNHIVCACTSLSSARRNMSCSAASLCPLHQPSHTLSYAAAPHLNCTSPRTS